MKRFQLLLPAGLAALAAFVASGCSANGAPHTSGRSLYVFLDLSGSVTSSQRWLWKREAALLARGLGDDCDIAVYALHDHTQDAARIFEAEIPAAAADGTRTIAVNQKKTRSAARAGALAALSAALDEGGKAARTDIFGAIDRVRPPRAGRRVQIFFFSDMLNSTPDFDMEKPGSLTRASVRERVEHLAQRHAWHSGQLAGAEVYCLLNSISGGMRGPVVDRLTQQVFYRSLFESLGARLVSYDTNMASPGNPAEGANNVAENQ